NSMITTGMEAFKNFGIFFAIIMGLAALSVGIAGFLYKNSARRGLEVGNKNNGKAKDNSVQSLKSALLKRDLKTCLGETSSAINYLIGFVLAPIIVIMLSFIYSNNPEMDSRYVMEIVSVFIVFMFGGGMNYFAIVGISREGRQMDVLKMLPVSSKTIINQKLMLSAIYTLVMAAILMASMFIAKLNFVLIMMLTLSILFAGNATNIFALHYDVKAPNFVWNNYKELFKNNYKSLNSMLLCLPIMIIGVISIICVDIVFAGQIPNTNLSCFVKMLPVLIASIVYLVVAVVYNYPKILETYEKIEI
ncbi:MAG: hypothetical protein K2P12_04480, partial [Clostridia bacterium]|nr:hypothetical protein [Clostridia bacterium]